MWGHTERSLSHREEQGTQSGGGEKGPLRHNPTLQQGSEGWVEIKEKGHSVNGTEKVFAVNDEGCRICHPKIRHFGVRIILS